MSHKLYRFNNQQTNESNYYTRVFYDGCATADFNATHAVQSLLSAMTGHQDLPIRVKPSSKQDANLILNDTRLTVAWVDSRINRRVVNWIWSEQSNMTEQELHGAIRYFAIGVATGDTSLYGPKLRRLARRTLGLEESDG